MELLIIQLTVRLWTKCVRQTHTVSALKQIIPFPPGWPPFVSCRACVMSNKSLWIAGGWRWDMDSWHSHFCRATWPIWTSVISDSFVCFWWHFTYSLLFWTETQDRGVSRFTASAFTGLLDFKRKSYLCTPEAWCPWVRALYHVQIWKSCQ